MRGSGTRIWADGFEVETLNAFRDGRRVLRTILAEHHYSRQQKTPAEHDSSEKAPSRRPARELASRPGA
jgi:hypothetical protein